MIDYLSHLITCTWWLYVIDHLNAYMYTYVY
jgi:hypothetical protein